MSHFHHLVVLLCVAQVSVSPHVASGLAVQACNTTSPISHICPDDKDNRDCDISALFRRVYGSAETVSSDDLFENCVSKETFPNRVEDESSCVAPRPGGQIQFFKSSLLFLFENGFSGQRKDYVKIGFNFVELGIKESVQVRSTVQIVGGPTEELSTRIRRIAPVTTCAGDPMSAGSFNLQLPLQPGSDKFIFRVKLSLVDSQLLEWEGEFEIENDKVSSEPETTELVRAASNFIQDQDIPKIVHQIKPGASAEPSDSPTPDSLPLTQSPSVSGDDIDATTLIIVVLGSLVSCVGVYVAKRQLSDAPAAKQALQSMNVSEPPNDGLMNEDWASAADNPLRVDSNASRRSVSSRFFSLMLPTWADRLSSNSDEKARKERKKRHKHRDKKKTKRKAKRNRATEGKADDLDVDLADVEDQIVEDQTESEGALDELAVVVETEPSMDGHKLQEMIPSVALKGPQPPVLPVRATHPQHRKKKKKKRDGGGGTTASGGYTPSKLGRAPEFNAFEL
jgi:hypothetical protein